MGLLSTIKNWFLPKEIEPDPMKYLIVGLGNMGADYDNTRHNVGFDVVDFLAKDNSVEWKNANLGDVAQFKHKGRTFVLLKPSTFMNRSGKSVRYWMQKEKIATELGSKISSAEEQFKKLAENIPSYSKFISIKQVKNPEKKGEFKLEYE